MLIIKKWNNYFPGTSSNLLVSTQSIDDTVRIYDNETDMSENKIIADLVFHLHPNTCTDNRKRFEESLGRYDGVVSVSFHEDVHPLAMVVTYKPPKVSSEELYAEVIKCDSQAMMVVL
jgi:hypothetical protein